MIYELGICGVALGSLLKPRSQFLTRLRAPKIKKHPQIWMHAVSVGETRALLPLAKYFDPRSLVISNVTATGHAEAQKLFPEADHVYLPFDFPWLMRSVRPDLILISETDFWANFQAAPCPVVLINGKLSERSTRRLKRFPKLATRLLGSLDLLCVQDEVYAQRFAACGVSPDKIHVTGNLKFDGLQIEEAGSQEMVVTLGSTHAPEERLCLEALRPLLDNYPQLKLVVVPRHPHRAAAVRRLAAHERIEVIGQMGALRSCYRRAQVALVGGSFTPKIGGHNLLEPAACGVPVIYGPHLHAQPEMDRLIKQYGAGKQVALADLRETVKTLLGNPQLRAQMGAGGHRLIQEAAGASEKTFQILSAVVPKEAFC